MLTNHIKVSLRSLARNKMFSVINILGLALGISIFLLIAQYIAFEWSANRFHKNYESLYRGNIFTVGTDKGDYYLPPGLADVLKNKVPGIKQVTRIADGLGSGVVVLNDGSASKSFTEQNVTFADDNFFKVFTFRLFQGTGSLAAPQTMAISRSIATKYFGAVNAIGKIITVKNQFGSTPYTITTVFADMPAQSDIRADILLSYKTLETAAFRAGNDWADPATLQSGYSFIYFQLAKTSNYMQVEQQATNVIRQALPGGQKTKQNFKLQPMANLHLAPGFNYPFQTFGSFVSVLSFLIVALLIITIAWLNYINLTTAQLLQRAKESGLRKVLGASRAQIVAQYLTETFIITFVSVGIALFLVVLCQPLYNTFLQRQLSLAMLNQGYFWPICAAVIFAGCALAGVYIATVISSFDPLKTIRSNTNIKIGGVSLRRGLVVFQFTISITLIIATITVYRQLQYMQTQDLGMSIKQKLVLTGPSIINGDKKANSTAFKDQLMQLPYIQKVASSNNIPGQGYNFTAQGITKTVAAVGDDKKSYAMLIVDDHYFDTYDIAFKGGSNFSKDMVNKGWGKAQKVILNEEAAKQLGFNNAADAVSKTIKWGPLYEVIGVVKDYHHLSLHEQIKPMIFLPAVADGYFTLKIDSRSLPAHIAQIKSLYERVFPGEPFSYVFEDEVFDRQYNTEQKLSSIFLAAAGSAIFIAALGLFGLAAFAARQRVKEIGIRKVLGAGVLNIVGLISADFVKLVMIAVVVASPIAWLAMHQWLQGFAYRISIHWWIFGLATVIALAIALLTISFQAVRAGMANPAKSLKNE